MITNQQDFNAALVRLDKLWPRNNEATEEFVRLLQEVSDYEDAHFSLPAPTAIDALLFRAEQEDRVNPCANCGSYSSLEYTDIVHRDTGDQWFQLWCGRCGFSSAHFCKTPEQALLEWNLQWEVTA